MQAGIYARMSRDVLGTRLGVDRQLQECRTLAHQRGWTVEPVHEFVDNDVSASTGRRRPAYEEMLTAVRSGRIKGVVVWDLDRLTRRPIEVEHFITLADEHHLALASVGGDVDLSTDNGRLFARIKGAVARAEVERKTARQQSSTQQAIRLGKPPTRRAFGYPGLDQRIRPTYDELGERTSETNTVQVAAEMVAAEAEAVRAVYAGLLAGDSILTLARSLNATGLTTTRGEQWSRNGVRSLLLNPRYAGLRAYKGEVQGKGTWEPLVDDETWRTVGGILADPGRATNTRRSTARIHLLGGLALCGVCADGTTMKTTYGGAHAGASSYRVYTCRKTKHLSRRADYIDTYVTEVMLSWASSPQAVQYLERQAGPDAADLRQEAATLNLRLDQLAEDFADGTLSREQMRAGSERLRHRLAVVEQSLQSTLSVTALGPLVGPDAATVWDGMNLDRRRQAIDLAWTVTLLPRGVGGRPISSRFDPELIAMERRTAGE